MAKVITISTSGDLKKAVKTLDRIRNNLPKMTRGVMRKWGNILAKDTKGAAMDADIKSFSGVLQDSGIRWEQSKKGDTGFLFIRLYGIMLDSMPPHFVNVTRRRTRLLAWSRQASSTRIRRKSRMIDNKEISKFAIYVKPHPFIKNGYARARPKLLPMIKRSTKLAINAA